MGIVFSAPSSHLDDLTAFVTTSPTNYHAASSMASRFADASFVPVDEKGRLPRGIGRFFVVRHGAVIVRRQSERIDDATGLRVMGAHINSPALKVKPEAGFSFRGWGQIAVEVYGGALLNSWLDRELDIAGRIITRDGAQHLARLDSVARLPQLAIHLDRSVSDDLRLDRQTHTQPVFTLDVEPGLLATLAEQAGVRPGDVLGHDLFTCLSQPPARFGLRNEFFASSRLDNLSSTYVGLTAIKDLSDGDDLVLLAAFDHEEIGSVTSSGAAGPFLEDVPERIAFVAGYDLDATKALLVCGSCISADVEHLVHPNYFQHYGPHVDLVSSGSPMLKINASQRYVTDAVGEALWLRTYETAGVPSQMFVSNNTIPCNSTIGPITATRLGMVTMDVGIGLLSIHSARETCGVDDPHHLAVALRAYLEG